MTNIAIIGATGNVGRKTLEVIEKKDIKFDNIFLVASSNSAGKKISFMGKDYEAVSYTHLTLPTTMLV